VGPRAGLDTEARGKTFASAGYRTPGVQSVDIHYTESGTPARVDNIVDITKFHFWTRIVYMFSGFKMLRTNLSFILVLKVFGEQGSSVSTVSGYGLDDRTIEVRSPAEAKGFFL
jgi:hypothetical protein